MGTFRITVGAPGSGKTTWADSLEGPKVFRLERDRMRVALFGSQRNYWDQTEVLGGDLERHKKLSRIVGSAMYHAMDTVIRTNSHQDIVLSDTGTLWEQNMRFVTLARMHDLDIEVNYFDVPWEVILERAKARIGTDKEVPIDWLKDTYQKVNNPKGWWQRYPIVVRDEFGKSKK